MQRIILTAIDDNPRYQDYLRTFLASLEANSPGVCVLVWAVNCSKEFCEKLMYRRPGYVVLAPKRENFNRADAAHIRGEMIAEALQDGIKQVAWIDADTLIRGGLAPLFEDVEPGVLKVTHRPQQDVEYRKFQSGVYVVGNSPGIRRLIAYLKRKVAKHREWYADQHYLYRGYKKYAKEFGIKLVSLERKWNDNHFGPESVIWHCAMKQKESSDVWNGEEARYRAVAQKAAQAGAGGDAGADTQRAD